VTGSADSVAAFVADREVAARQQLGRTAPATLVRAQPGDRERARAAGLELGPVALQDLFVHLTERAAEPTSKEAARR
jgi:ABC-2 type transport system ATP-binding protein